MQNQLERSNNGKVHAALSFPPENTPNSYKMPVSTMHLMFSG